MRLRLIAASVILFVLALGFNIFFNLTSLDKLYTETLISQYRVVGKDIQRSVQRGLNYGKRIESFTNIENILADNHAVITKSVNDVQKTYKDVEHVKRGENIDIFVTRSNGEILYSNSSNPGITRLPKPVMKDIEKYEKASKSVHNSHYTKYNGSYFSTFALKDKKEQTKGIIAIAIKANHINHFLDHIFKQNFRITLMIAATGIMLLILILYTLLPTDRNIKDFSKKKTTIIIFLVIGSVLISTYSVSTYKFGQVFIRINKENTSLINEQLKRDVEYLLNIGARIDRLSRLDRYLGKIISESPEIENITLYDHRDQPLYRATKNKVTDFQRSKNAYSQWVEATQPVLNPDYNVRIDLMKDTGYKGYFSINASKDILFKKLIDNIMDSLTVIIVSLLFFVEMLILIFKYIERKAGGKAAQQTIDYGVMRPAAFLFLFGIDISVSFLPLHMESLYVPILNLSRETIMGLPISVEFLFVGIAILISGVWLDRRGWHEPFVSGLAIAAVGVMYSWWAADALQFIVSRGVVGFGYGLSLMAAQGFVISFTDWKTKAQGLAHLFAGIYAGSICGTATGGMLAEWMGYSPVFLVGTVILIGVIIYTLLFMRTAMRKPATVKVQTTERHVKTRNLFQFLFNRTILGLIFFSSLPAAIAVIGFMNYFSPIYLNRIGASQSTIGQVLMLYGICLIYFGPFVSRYVDASNNKKVYIIIGCLLGSVALLTFYFMEGIPASVVAVILFGLSSSFVLASQSVYALKLQVTQKLGEGKAIGIFRSTSRVGQMLGPIVFSATIAATNIKVGITYLGIAYLLTAFLFLLFTQSDLKAVLLEDA